MSCRLDRLCPLTWRGFRLVCGSSRAVSITPTTRPMRPAKHDRFLGQKSTTWLRRTPETTSRSNTKLARRRFFWKRPICDPLAPVQSKHDFCHAISTRFRRKCGPGGLLKKDTYYTHTKWHLLCVLVSFSEPQGAPRGTSRRPFGIIFSTFCMTWPDNLSSLLPASNFGSKTTLQTSKSIRIEQVYQQKAASS